jgi:hypothetical protein
MWIDIQPQFYTEIGPMPIKIPKYSVGDDFDLRSDISTDSDPMVEYLTYLAYVQDCLISDMGFTLKDFRNYISELPRSGTPI